MARKQPWTNRKWGGAPWWGWAIIAVGTIAAVVVLVVAATRPVPAATPYTPPSFDLPTIPSPVALPATPNILFYGDSITVGSFADTDADTFRGIVTAVLNGRPTVVAQKGIQTFSFLQKTPVPPIDADLAVIELGTNDAGATPPAQFAGSYAELIDSVRKRSKAIVCLSVWGNTEKARPYNEAIRNACSATTDRYVDITSRYPNENYRGPAGQSIGGEMTDNFHPNTKGHAAIAAALLSAIGHSQS